MNKLIFTLNAVILFSMLPTQSMEPTSYFVKTTKDRSLDELRRSGRESQLVLPSNTQNNSDCPLPNFKLEDELIFACCQILTTPLTSPIRSKKELTDSIRNFIYMRSTCKKYYEFLTYEKIGDFCKDHSVFAKNACLFELTCFPVINYSYRHLILILIHANAKFQDKQKILLEASINHSDVYLLTALLKHKANPNDIKYYYEDPLIFSVKTVKIAQILMNNGVDIHASRNTGYNFLSDLLRRNPQCTWTHKNRLLSDGTEFSFEEGNVEFIRPTDQATWELIEFCLNHNVIMSDEDRELYNKFINQPITKKFAVNNNSIKHKPISQEEIIKLNEEQENSQTCIIF